jgi:hypothetical protein
MGYQLCFPGRPPQAGSPYPDLGLLGAGDENRTRTISLGSGPVTAARGADQASLAVPSDPGCPLVTLANGTLMARRTCSIAELRQEFEVLHVGEDAIVRHEGNLEPDRCRSHPAVRLMLLLAQAVPGTVTPCAERRIRLDKVRPRPDDLRPGYLILQPPQFSWAPPGQSGAITKLSDGDE